MLSHTPGRDARAFTLAENLVAIVVMGVTSMSFMTSVSTSVKSARWAEESQMLVCLGNQIMDWLTHAGHQGLASRQGESRELDLTWLPSDDGDRPRTRGRIVIDGTEYGATMTLTEVVPGLMRVELVVRGERQAGRSPGVPPSLTLVRYLSDGSAAPAEDAG